MTFRIRGLDPSPFLHLYDADMVTLRGQGAARCVVDKPVGFPCRVEVRDAAPGETVLLLNHVHQVADTPYRASHAIFVREGASAPLDVVDTVPEALARRTLSLRGFRSDHWMHAAELVDGAVLDGAIARLFADPAVAYLQVHYAARGCFAARVERT